MTKKLYYFNPYLTNWSTKIIDIQEVNNQILVELEETAFYPEGGGQPADTGRIDSIEVEDVQIVKNKIYHVVKKKPINHVVDCEIDWKVRFDHMQQHTAQHLLSAVIEQLYKIHTVSFHLGMDYTTIDIDINELSQEQMTLIEKQANHYITKNVKIETYFVTQDQLATIPLRKLPKVTENIRIVEINELDISACAGTHVNQTGELNILKLIKTEKLRGQTRLYFLSGERAIKDYQNSHSILESMSSMFQTNKLELLSRLEKLDKDKKELAKENESLKNQLNEYLVHTLLTKSANGIIKEVFEEKSIKDISQLAKLATINTSSIVLFASLLDKKILLQHNRKQPIHCGNHIKSLLSTFDGKGGGNEHLAQATFTSVENLFTFMKELERNIQEELQKK